MSADFASFPDTRLHHRIENELRHAILTGAMAYGSKLPSARELAVKFQTSAFTIQNALKPLVQEGLIERTRKRGSFVRARANQLVSVGIYFCSDFWKGSNAALYRELYGELLREFSTERIRHKLWIDYRSPEEQARPLPDLEAAIQRREFQGLMVGLTNSFSIQWLNKAAMPITAYSSAPTIPARVNFDWHQMFGQALRELKRQGCKSVGILSPMPIWGPDETDHAEDVVGFTREFVNLSADLGITLRREWVRTPPGSLPVCDHELFGYRQFLNLWQQRERPDGLIVYPDGMVRGAVTAILQAGVSVPNDLKVVLHRNEGIPVLCPFPASWLVTNPRHIALAMIDQLKGQLQGRQMRPAYLSFGIEASEGIR